MEVGSHRHAPAALPPGRTRYPLYRCLGGRRSRSGRVRKISPPIGIRYPICPSCSESLHRLRYPGSRLCVHNVYTQYTYNTALYTFLLPSWHSLTHCVHWSGYWPASARFVTRSYLRQLSACVFTNGRLVGSICRYCLTWFCACLKCTQDI